MKDITLREGEFGARHIKAVGGLHYIRGNPLPYFTLTIVSKDVHGAMHDELLRHWPELKPLADLHMSDMNGVPMHAESNGWYWLAGTVKDAFGQQFHGGNSDPLRDAAECLRIFAKHVRISHQDAADLRERTLALAKHYGNKQARESFATWIEDQKPRWKLEADDCIASLDLQVFGDHWIAKQADA